MKKENIEIRRIVELRAAGEGRTISGTAIVFNTESVLLQDMFTEIIEPGAVTPALLAECDILMLVNHEDEMIPLARSKKGTGTLNIVLTPTGVDFSFEAKKTATGDEILAAVRAGDMDSMSFAFIVAENGDKWMSKPDGTYLRTISKFELFTDFSIVNGPAYIEASCRSLDKFKETRTEPPTPPADPPAPPADPPAPPADPLEDYYKEFESDVEALKTGTINDTLPDDIKASYESVDADIAKLKED